MQFSFNSSLRLQDEKLTRIFPLSAFSNVAENTFLMLAHDSLHAVANRIVFMSVCVCVCAVFRHWDHLE